ncbi:TetR/AcrR family transcriptional regulator [Vibrio fluvialis]|uniref:TetR/AcrR family transcriptional regulator n=1 Tax=Vibrio fluvialis TaxID=676 RepID=UPI000C227245|nr:TetR/AcrR family transcriptional regulator [Vibrio fluvialis]MBY7824253.1 TetR/AcrR family transcriptional regulator [Vibrio fluvialis]MBY7884162.1 TetR/AcrR family transcriptional regulator [Vibrio fluvialis]MBY7926822.1 TetR/AcrR family transcriptional regulator [Vibrio fluvialis]MBY8008292.1 TetR/AcrR family transcriptional regulator [Vibrio fluvialis]MBY8254187.1 TetR/AcrR family transcriptional regulator [Vibrio fluvialis]
MSDKREQLIQTALLLFYQYGIRAIGINEVLKKSGIAKKTLYHHFSSKEDLVLAALQYRDAIFLDWLRGEVKSFHPGLEAMQGLFTALDRWFHNDVPELNPFRGCFFINTAVEYREDNPQLAEYCRAHKAKVRDLVRQCLTDEQAQQAELLDTLCVLKEGSIVTAQVNGDMNAARPILSLLPRLLA